MSLISYINLHPITDICLSAKQYFWENGKEASLSTTKEMQLLAARLAIAAIICIGIYAVNSYFFPTSLLKGTLVYSFGALLSVPSTMIAMGSHLIFMGMKTMKGDLAARAVKKICTDLAILVGGLVCLSNYNRAAYGILEINIRDAVRNTIPIKYNLLLN